MPTACVAGDTPVEYQGSSGLAWTCSPSGLPRYVVNGDGTLTDNQTGLMWEMKTSACGGEITCVNDRYTWSTGDNNPDGTLYTSFLATLNGGDYSLSAGQDVSHGPSACFANHCDWRIPTVAELNTIVETSAPGCGSSSPCIDPAFGPTPRNLYWSSSSTVYTGAWCDLFASGFASECGELVGYYARAVRTAR
jgi:hypothetical protein